MKIGINLSDTYYVKVGKYIYSCQTKLKVGDKVILPPPWSSVDVQTVTEIDVVLPEGFKAPIKAILRALPDVIKPKEEIRKNFVKFLLEDLSKEDKFEVARELIQGMSEKNELILLRELADRNSYDLRYLYSYEDLHSEYL